jgi:hypothetical protein
MIYGDYGTAIRVDRSNESRFAHTRVHGTAADAAMVFSQSSRVSVQPCSLYSNTPVGIALTDSCNDDTLARVTMLGTTTTGITVLENRGLVLANNCIMGWTDVGVALASVQSPRLWYNTIIGPESAGTAAAYLFDVTRAEARDNILWNRGGGNSTCYYIVAPFPFASGASDYNDLCTSDSGSVASVNDTVFAGLAEWRTHPSAPDMHSLSRDPRTVPGDNFHLSSTSPCRDAGIPIAAFPYDIELDQRDPVSPDIGADEYSVGAVSEAQAAHQLLRFELRGNPTTRGSVVIACGPAIGSRLDVSVVDVAGRTVLKRRIIASGSQQRVDLGNLQAGVYVVRVASEESAAALKLVVQK